MLNSQPNYETLVELCKSMFYIDESTDIEFEWRDNDYDIIRMSSGLELEEAIRCMSINENLIKVDVVTVSRNNSADRLTFSNFINIAINDDDKADADDIQSPLTPTSMDSFPENDLLKVPDYPSYASIFAGKINSIGTSTESSSTCNTSTSTIPYAYASTSTQSNIFETKTTSTSTTGAKISSSTETIECNSASTSTSTLPLITISTSTSTESEKKSSFTCTEKQNMISNSTSMSIYPSITVSTGTNTPEFSSIGNQTLMKKFAHAGTCTGEDHMYQDASVDAMSDFVII